MSEPPTYTVATDFDEIEQLREVIDACAPGQQWKTFAAVSKAPEQ